MEKTILVIDDDYFMQKLLKILLHNEGHHVFVASSTDEAFRILSSHSIDIILCDVFMPEADGLTFLKNVKSSPNFSQIPVIIITAASNHPHIQSTLNLGACCIIEKPFNVQVIKEAINKAISA